MVWTSKAILSLVELILYASLTSVVVYTLYKHRLPSLVGHTYLFAFVVLRLVADGLAISHRNDAPGSNTTGSIINSIGVSPLLLATAGFLNESRSYVLDYARNKDAKKMGWIMDLSLHVLVVTGVALLATGNSNAATATILSDINKYRALAYTGAILLLVAWLLIYAWAYWTFRVSSKQKKEGVHNPLARTLLTEIMISLHFTGVRVCYSVVYTFDHSQSLSPVTASFVVDFFLIFLVQLLAATVLMLGLVVTRSIRGSASARGENDAQPASTVTRLDKIHPHT